MWVKAAALGCVIALAGCGSLDQASERIGDDSGDADGEQRASAAVGLVGLWTVEHAGEDPDAVLRLDVTELGLFRDCGVIHGQWRANAEGLFVAGTAGWSGACGDGDPTPQWLLAAAAHRSDGDGHLLLNKTGAIVARLTPGDVPDVPPTVAESLARPPVLTDEDRRALAPAASLPAGLTPASRDALLGRWRPLDAPAGSDAHAHLHADQTWTGSDGCNGLGGRWRSGPDAAFLATGGPSTEIGCENLPVEQMLTRAARAGFDGDVLVLVDRHGAPLGRFRPS